MYQSEPSEWTGGRPIPVPRGKTLGGSSSINGHVYNRGQRMDYDGWAQRGNLGWGYADVLPYFKRCEQRIGGGDDTFRGRTGECQSDRSRLLRIRSVKPLWMVPARLGIPRNSDYNGAVQEGISYVQRSTYRGRRVSTATAFLHPAKRRPNLTLRTRAHATRIVLDGKRADRSRICKGRAQRRTYHGACASGGDLQRRRNKFATTAAVVGNRTGSSCCSRWASTSNMIWPALARTCAIISRRAFVPGSRTSRRSMNVRAG